MLYGLIRFIIAIVIFVIIFILVKKSKHRNILIVADIIIVCIIGLLLHQTPFENLFIGFSSPEDVFNYTSSGQITDMVYGDNSVMIVYTSDNSINYCFTIKENDTYKIVTPAQMKKDNFLSKDGIAVNITTLDNINDSYALGTVQHNVKITDNSDSDYKLIPTDFDTIYKFYGYVNNYDESYSLYLDSEKVNFI